MAQIIISTNTDYAEQLMSVRRLASPNAAVPLTAAQLPDSFITDPAYLDSSERFVLRKLKKTTAPVPTDDDYSQIVFLVQLRIAIRLIPQLPIILRQTMVGETVQVKDVDLEKRLNELEEIFADETEDITPDSDTAKIKVKVLATTKKPWPHTSYGSSRLWD